MTDRMNCVETLILMDQFDHIPADWMQRWFAKIKGDANRARRCLQTGCRPSTNSATTGSGPEKNANNSNPTCSLSFQVPAKKSNSEIGSHARAKRTLSGRILHFDNQPQTDRANRSRLRSLWHGGKWRQVRLVVRGLAPLLDLY